MFAAFHKLPPSCWLALPEKERPAEQACRCEDGHHDEDWVKTKPKFSYGEKLELAERMAESATAGLCWMLERGIVEWSLKDTSTRLVNPIEGASGEPLQINARVIYDLDEETADYIQGLFDDRKQQAAPAEESEAGGPKAPAKRSRKR